MLTSRRLGSDPQLRKASENSPALASGSRGSGVSIMQDLLADLGYPLPKSLAKGTADGIFGTETLAAVKAFQSNCALKSDGIAGRMTMKALDDAVNGNQRLEEKDGRKSLDRGYW